MPDESERSAPEPAKAVSRRGFLAAAAVTAPAALGAWQIRPAAEAAAPQEGCGPREPRMRAERHMLVHERIAAVVGASPNAQVLPLERAERGFLQRIQTDDDRLGTALATVLRPVHDFRPVRTGPLPMTARVTPVPAVTVRVENKNGQAWPGRTIKEQSDLVYAMKDALAGNTLAEGVLRSSLQPGSPVVALFRPVVVRLPVGAVSDIFGNHIEPASGGASAVFNPNVSGIALATSVREGMSS